MLMVALFLGCINDVKNVKTVSKPDSPKSSIIRQTPSPPLTDSAKLSIHLDSLPKAVFPRNVSDWNRGAPNINLADFKNKKLHNLSYQLIPRQIGGAGIDMGGTLDTTFSLCDTNFRANWFLITKTPKFFVVEVDDNYLLLVTIDYRLNVLDAIHIAAGDPSSNDNFQGELTATIYKNLNIVMHYRYDQRTDKEGHSETINEDDQWGIDSNGHFKPIHYLQPGDDDPKSNF